MNNRTITGLALGLIFLIAIITYRQLVSQKSSEPELLLPSLRESINDVSGVAIKGAGDETVATLSITSDGWVVKERSNYPANTAKLRTLLLQLADARLIEKKTAKPELYDRLGVQDLSDENAKGAGLQLTGGIEADLIIGDSAGTDTRYVRRAGDQQSWLIDQDAEVPGDIGDWLEPDIVDLSSGRVHAVTVSHPSGDRVRIVKNSPEEPNFSVLDIPQGRSLSYDSVANVIGGVLDGLTLDDVGVAEPPGADAVETKFETFDGVVITVVSEKIGEQGWVSLSAEHDQDLAARFAPAASDDSAAEAAPGPPQGGATETEAASGEGEAEAERINTRVKNWRFQIPSYKFDQLTRNWSDLLQSEDE